MSPRATKIDERLEEVRARREAERAEALQRLQEEEDMRTIADTETGRRVLHRIIYGTCGVLRQAFTGNSATFFNDGRRSVGLQLLAELTETCPDEARLMMLENLDRQMEKDHDRGKHAARNSGR